MKRFFELGLLWLGALILISGCATTSDPMSKAEHRGSPYTIDAPPPEAGVCSADAPAQKWAVVVGINYYADDRIPDLGGAVNDAWSLYHYLASPEGGGVSPYRLQLLLNHEATRTNIEGALGNFLAQACPQDQVIIFFAGHGAPEPERPDDAFLLVHDTDVDNLVGSAISMQRLPEFLEWRAGQAGNLLMFIDACHSGNIVFPGQRKFIKGKDTEEAKKDQASRAQSVTKSIDKLVKGKSGWGAMVATAADQTAGESSASCTLGGVKYAGGLFTCHIMEGLAGDADEDKDGSVTLGELEAHVTRTVSADTDGQQVPQLSGTLDKTMNMGKYGKTSIAIPKVPERYLIEGDPRPFRPWVYAAGTATALAATVGAIFAFQANNAATEADADVNGGTGLSKSAYQDRRDQYTLAQNVSNASYVAAAVLGVTTLTLLGLDIFGEPEDIDDVYEMPPWFRLEITPKANGAMGVFGFTF